MFVHVHVCVLLCVELSYLSILIWYIVVCVCMWIAHVCLRVFACLYTCTNVRVRVHVRVHAYVCMCVCVGVCVYV